MSRLVADGRIPVKSCPGCAEKVAENPCGHRFDASAPIAESKEAPSVDGSREWKDLSTWEKYVAVVVLMCLAIAVGLSIYLFVNGFYNGGGVLENLALVDTVLTDAPRGAESGGRGGGPCKAPACGSRHQILLGCSFSSLQMTPSALGYDAELRRGLRLIA